MVRFANLKIAQSVPIITFLLSLYIVFSLTRANQGSFAANTAILETNTADAEPLSSSPPDLFLPYMDVINGPISLTAGAGGAWGHDTRIFTEKAYDVDAVGEGTVGLRISYLGIDLTGLQFDFFPNVEDLSDWHFNRWEGGTQTGLCTADNLVPPPAQENVAMGPHLKNSAGVLIYVNPAPNQGGNTWWAPDIPGSPWDSSDPVNSGYDVRDGHGQVVNYAGKGLYTFPGAPFTDPLEGDLVFTGEYDGFSSNHWYRKDSIMPHTEWVTELPPTQEQIHAVNTFDMVIDYTPIIINGRSDHKRYKVEWWYRKHQSSAKLEGGPSWWVPDANDPTGGWIQPTNSFWYFGGYASDGTMTGLDEPGFDFSAVFPYVSAFGWWREDQPEQTVVVHQVVIEYVASTNTTGPNEPPMAYEDSYNLNEDGKLTVSTPGVLGNDDDGDGDPLTAVLVSGVSDGALTLNTTGSFTYTPDANFNGTDSFTYKADDELASSNIVSATITVEAVNDAPQLTVPGSQTVGQESALTIAGISLADVDVGSNNLVVSLSALSGTLTLNSVTDLTFGPGDGVNDKNVTFTGTLVVINAALNDLIYQGNPGFIGQDTISLSVNDQGHTGAGGVMTDTAIINVTVDATSETIGPTYLPIIFKN